MRNASKFILFTVISIFCQTIFAQSETELQKLVADDRASTDLFGFSVSIDGDYAIVGAFNEDEDTSGGNTLVNAGSAYIFERTAEGSWQQAAKLIASDRNSGDFFGSSVSINGNYVIVGSYNEDEDAAGGNTANTAGSAYIFEKAANGTWVETAKLVASDRATSDVFGEAVAIDGDYAVVGARAEDQDADGGNFLDNAGSAYIFQRAGDGTWSEVTKLVASDRAPFDNFGASVAIDGDYVIIGANFEDEDVNGENTATEAGAAYVFERSSDDTWTEVAKLVASDRANDDFFGFPVAISGDKVVVGAHQEDEDAIGENRLSRAGSAYIFERSTEGVWAQSAKLVASDRGVADFFGISVDISGDNIVVGAYESENQDTRENVGAAYVFERSTDGDWTETIILAASDRAEDDEFGFAVAIDGNDIFIGANKEDEDENDENTANAAGSVYVFKLPATFTQPETELQKLVADDRASTDFFGFSVSIDGDYAIVGAYNEDEDVLGGNTLVNAGSAYIFERISDGSWQQQTKLVASDRNSGDFFGSSVSVRGDYAIVGAYNEDEDVSGGNTTNTAGSAYIFERAADGTWAETSKLAASDRAVSDLFGEAVAVDGDYAVIGARAEDQDADGGNVLDNAGSAYVFKRASDGTWSEVTKLVASDRAPFDNFGASVAIDGDYVIIGANFEDEDVNGENTADEAGAAYVFERSNDDTWTEVAKLVASDRANNDFFGFPVAISGNRAVVGAHQEDEDAMGENRVSRAGSAYVFERSSDDTWTEVAKLVASDRGVADFFGISVDISGDNVVVGAYQSEDGDTGENVGAAYIFERSTYGNWMEKTKFMAGDRAEDDEFGFSVAIDGNDILIGANREDEDENNDNTASAAGSVYVFELPSTVGTVTSVEEITNVDIHVFPNPTTDKVSIAMPNIDVLKTTVNVVDFMGRMYKVRSGINQDKLDIELPEAKGVYVIQIVSNDGLIYSTRVIKI